MDMSLDVSYSYTWDQSNVLGFAYLLVLGEAQLSITRIEEWTEQNKDCSDISPAYMGNELQPNKDGKDLRRTVRWKVRSQRKICFSWNLHILFLCCSISVHNRYPILFLIQRKCKFLCIKFTGKKELFELFTNWRWLQFMLYHSCFFFFPNSNTKPRYYNNWIHCFCSAVGYSSCSSYREPPFATTVFCCPCSANGPTCCSVPSNCSPKMFGELGPMWSLLQRRQGALWLKELLWSSVKPIWTCERNPEPIVSSVVYNFAMVELPALHWAGVGTLPWVSVRADWYPWYW